MWYEFTKVDQNNLEIETECDEDENDVYYIDRLDKDDVAIFGGDRAIMPMVGVLPSGQIVDSIISPECDPYFVVTFTKGPWDIITDGEKYAWVDNKSRDRGHCHYVGEKCFLLKKKHPYHCDLTTHDARIIRTLIKVHLGLNKNKEM